MRREFRSKLQHQYIIVRFRYALVAYHEFDRAGSHGGTADTPSVWLFANLGAVMPENFCHVINLKQLNRTKSTGEL